MCKKCHFSQVNKTSKKVYVQSRYNECIVCRTSSFMPINTYKCNKCATIIPSDNNPEVECIICDDTFIFLNNAYKRCSKCVSTNAHKCSDCNIVHYIYPKEKCFECLYKNISCRVCGNNFSTIPSDRVLRCTLCVNAFSSVYDTFRIEFTYEISTDASDCEKHSIIKVMRKLRKDIKSHAPNCCTYLHSEDESYDDTKITTVVRTYPLTKLITQDDIDPTNGKVNVNNKYIRLYDDMNKDDECGCDCDISCTTVGVRVYKVHGVNLLDDT